jgi:Ca-activated chloride channel family protein
VGLIAFEHSAYLYLLWMPTLLLILFARYKLRQAKALKAFGSSAIIKQLTGGYPGYLPWLKFSLLLLSLFALILALAAPFIPGSGNQQITSGKIDLVFVTDVSKSMYAEDVHPNRLNLMKRFVVSAINKFHDADIGIVAFAGKAMVYMPLNNNHEYAVGLANTLSADLITTQGTSLSDALKISSLLFEQSSGNTRVICLLSDGEGHTKGVEKIADSLKKAGIHVFAFGIGSVKGAWISENPEQKVKIFKTDSIGQRIVSRLNVPGLNRITANTPNHYLQLTNNDEGVAFLTKGLKELGSGANQSGSVQKNLFQIALLLALLCLLTELILP